MTHMYRLNKIIHYIHKNSLQYIIIVVTITTIVAPSLILNYVPFYHVDFINEYASYIAHGEYMAYIHNPLFFWWAYGPQIPVKIISLIVPLLKIYIKNEFILFLIIVKLNTLIQMLAASFSMLLLAREIFGKNNLFNIIAALAYPLTPYFLSETAMYSARTWAYALAPLVPWIAIRYYKLALESERYTLKEKLFNILAGGLFISITIFNPLDSIVTIGAPSLLLAFILIIYILFDKNANKRTLLKYIYYIISSIIVSLLLSLYFLYPLIHSYMIWPFRETHFVTHHIVSFVEHYTPSPLEALQGINVEHKYHFSHIYPFKDMIIYPSIVHSFLLLILLALSLIILRFRHKNDKALFFYLIIMLVGLILLFMSSNLIIFGKIRNTLPLAFYLRKPYRLLIFWNIVLSLAPAFIGYLVSDKNKHKLTKNQYKIIKSVTLISLIIMLVYLVFAFSYAYKPPMSVLANYESIYTSYIKSWRRGVVEGIWNCLNMSKALHKDLTAAYTSAVHAFTYNYPGFTDAQDMLYWTHYYATNPEYQYILSLYGIKYVIEPSRARTPLTKICTIGNVSVRRTSIDSSSGRLYVGYPVLSVGGPDTLSLLPYVAQSLGEEMSHNLSVRAIMPVFPIFVNTLSLKQLNETLLSIDTVAFHDTSIIDLVATMGIYHDLGKPIVDIDKPLEVKEAIKNGWRFFEPGYYGYLAPLGMHDSIYGQVVYGNYVLIGNGASRPLVKFFAVTKSGIYILMIRIGKFDPINTSVTIIVGSDNKNIIARTIIIQWLGFKWIPLALNIDSPGKYFIKLIPHNKIWIDNIFIIFQKNRFYQYKSYTYKLLQEKNIIYLYNAASVGTLFGKAVRKSINNEISDKKLGVLYMTKNSYLLLNINIINNNTYILLIRYKSINPSSIKVFFSSKEKVFVKEIEKSRDIYNWFYNIYIIKPKINDTIISIKILATSKSYIDIFALIPIRFLEKLYPSLVQNGSRLLQLNGFRILFHGVKWSPKGFYFDGIDDFIELNMSRKYGNLRSFTLLAVLRAEGTPGQIFISQDLPTLGRKWSLWWATIGNTIKAFIGTKQGLLILNTDMKPLIDKYAVYGIVCNGSYVSIVVNNRIVKSIYIGSAMRLTGAVPIIIGTGDGRVAFLRGYMLAFMIYDRALSLREIQYIAHNPLSPIKSGLVLDLNPFIFSLSKSKEKIEKTLQNKIKWHYVMHGNIIISGMFSCSVSPCGVVFSWPMRLPNEFLMKIGTKTTLPIKSLYILHGYILPYKGTYTFSIIYNPDLVILISRIVSLISWIIVIFYIFLFIIKKSIKGKKL